MNQHTHITPQRRERSLRWRFNPLRSVTPEALARQLDNFEAGYLGEAANTWELIEKRDDLLKAVVPKRKKAVARHGWEVLPLETVPPGRQEEAQRHAEALRYFYQNLHCANAIDENEQGGFQLLVRQMMDAVGKRYAVHEIVWKPETSRDRAERIRAAGGAELPRFVSAEFRFVPLTFFENTTGRLRFLGSENQLVGSDLAEGEWMVTVADGLMVASSIAWMFKHLTLNDWSTYSGRQGKPGVQGLTTAAKDSEDFESMVEAVTHLLEGESIVTNTNEEVRVLDLAKGGNVPFPALVDRLDRMIAALWRGADLSTLSRDKGYGASLQDKEASILEEDDAVMIAETLHRHADEWVIRYVFGPDVKPLAGIKVLVAGRESTDCDLRIDDFLVRNGAPLSVGEALLRYGRAEPKPGEPLLRPSGSAREKAAMPNEAGPDAETPGKVALANTAAGEGLVGFQNEFAPLQGEWVQLAPFGDFPHGKGTQRVDSAAAEEMVRRFNSFFAKLGRWFTGAPFYVGHPDAPALAPEYPDKKAYGWIMELEARADGLYGKTKWSDAGRELIRNAHYKFLSPYWEAEEIQGSDGRKVFRPVRLISVGLTNQPNLPVLPLANEQLEAAGGGDSKAEIRLLNGQIDALRQQALDLEQGPRSGQTPAEAAAGLLESVGLGNGPTPLRPMKTKALTNSLGLRKSEISRAQSRHAKVQELVAAKMQTGLSYDEAWEAVKQEAPGIFGMMNRPQ